MQKTPLTIVLDGNQRSALAAVRSLGGHGVPVQVAEARAGSLAASSKFCRGELLYPDPAKSPGEFEQWLGRTGRAFPGAVLMPMTDVTVPLVLQADVGPHGLRTALPSLEAYETVTDKYRLFELARNAGVRVPETAIVSRASVGALNCESFRFPVVVKPRQSSMRLQSGTTKRSVKYAVDAADLRHTILDMLIDDTDELLLQEYVEGYGAGVFGIYDRGTPRFFFSHRRIREKPPSGGVSVLCESVPLLQAGVDAARRLLDPLGWHGVAMIEFKADTRGNLWLIEINARFWGSLQLAVDCGADFPWFLYQIACGDALKIPERYAVGHRLRWWLGDLDNLYARLRDSRWTPSLRQKAKAIAQFAQPWQPRTRHEFLRWSDPAPALKAFRQYIAALAGRSP